jgi:SmpA / OmlA family
MSRHQAICRVWLLYLTLPLIAMAQPPDPRIDVLGKEAAELKITIADQERRIVELERIVKALQVVAAPVPTAIPTPIPPWHSAANWILIKKGMSEAQVVEILGSPTSVDSTVDVRTLFYQPDSRATTTLNGTVTLTDDRVTALVPPAF